MVTGIFMDIYKLVQAKREEIFHIASRHGVHKISLFGSVARGEAGASSDIDFLIEAGPERTPWFPGGLIADLEDLLGCRVDIVTEKALHWYIRDRVLQEAVPL
jgi:uncharacterized protein